jgi:hypothetical protein
MNKDRNVVNVLNFETLTTKRKGSTASASRNRSVEVSMYKRNYSTGTAIQLSRLYLTSRP